MFLSCIALILVALAGSVLAHPSAGRGWIDLAGRLGQGYFIGMLAVGLCALAFERAGSTGYAWPLAAAVALAAMFGLRRLVAQLDPATDVRSRRSIVVGGALVVLVAAHFLFAASEAAQQPVFPWDAWETWMYRARAMFLHPGAEFALPAAVDGFTGTPHLYPSKAAHYPLALGAAVVWLARLHGEWRDPLLLIAWPLAWLALVATFSAIVRGQGLARPTAALLIAVLASTPLLTVHAALAGYMDLWMCGYLLIAAAALGTVAVRPDHATTDRTPRPLAWAHVVALALAPALVKVEGLVWVVLLVLALAWGWSGRRLRAISLLAIALLLLAWFLPEAGLHAFGDRLVLSRDFVRLPYLGESPLALNPLLRPLWLALFGTATFGATWYLIAAGTLLLPWGLRQAVVRPAPAQALLLRFALLAACFVLVLFGATVAGIWAENHTALSRILLQLTPALLLAVAPALDRALALEPAHEAT